MAQQWASYDEPTVSHWQHCVSSLLTIAPPPQKLQASAEHWKHLKSPGVNKPHLNFAFSGMFFIRLHKLRRGNGLAVGMSSDNAACFSLVSPTDAKIFARCSRSERGAKALQDEERRGGTRGLMRMDGRWKQKSQAKTWGKCEYGRKNKNEEREEVGGEKGSDTRGGKGEKKNGTRMTATEKWWRGGKSEGRRQGRREGFADEASGVCLERSPRPRPPLRYRLLFQRRLHSQLGLKGGWEAPGPPPSSLITRSINTDVLR